MYEVVLTSIHENIFSYALPYVPGKDANVAEAFEDWSQIIDALSTGDTERAVSYTKDHIRRYAERMKAGMKRKKISG
jgi:DNA-binding GntR family transcriptional regulator